MCRPWWGAAVSVLTAPIGARLTHQLPVGTLKKVFAGILLALAGEDDDGDCSARLEVGFAFFQEGASPFPVVLGSRKAKRGFFLVSVSGRPSSRRRIHCLCQPATSGAPGRCGAGHRLRLPPVRPDDAGQQALLVGLAGAFRMPFEQDFL